MEHFLVSFANKVQRLPNLADILSGLLSDCNVIRVVHLCRVLVTKHQMVLDLFEVIIYTCGNLPGKEICMRQVSEAIKMLPNGTLRLATVVIDSDSYKVIVLEVWKLSDRERIVFCNDAIDQVLEVVFPRLILTNVNVCSEP